MSFRPAALAMLSATILAAACSDQPTLTAPARRPKTPASVIAVAGTCNGATMPVAECQALVALYNSTNGPGWTNNAGWGVDENPCDWVGVGCTDGDHGSVLSLLFHNNGLNGPIPPELGNLTQAHLIDLYGNQLTGPIPPELGGLVSLRWLHLGLNQLTGSIPSALGGLSSLERLSLWDNQLSGPIPPELGNLSNLEWLALARNALSGPIPQFLTQLNNLTLLDLAQNQFSGVLPLSVASFGEGLDFVCQFAPGNAAISVPDIQSYRDADLNEDGTICGLPLSTAEDIGEDATDNLDDLVPGTLNAGQANALKTKIANAVAKAANGQYAAAINQMQAFISQLTDMVAKGTLTAVQAAPFIVQAESMIAIWTDQL
jgi:hypothetical protein